MTTGLHTPVAKDVAYIKSTEAKVSPAVTFKDSKFSDTGESTRFRYSVTVGENPTLSHFILGICPEAEVVGASHPYELMTDTADPPTGIKGIKFNSPGGPAGNVSVDYWIDVKGKWTEEGLIDSAITAGTATWSNKVNGPACSTHAAAGALSTKASSSIPDTANTDQSQNPFSSKITHTAMRSEAAKPSALPENSSNQGTPAKWKAADSPQTTIDLSDKSNAYMSAPRSGASEPYGLYAAGSLAAVIACVIARKKKGKLIDFGSLVLCNPIPKVKRVIS